MQRAALAIVGVMTVVACGRIGYDPAIGAGELRYPTDDVAAVVNATVILGVPTAAADAVFTAARFGASALPRERGFERAAQHSGLSIGQFGRRGGGRRASSMSKPQRRAWRSASRRRSASVRAARNSRWAAVISSRKVRSALARA